MKAVVVYESHWGNTAAIALAIAEGLGAETQALLTSEAAGAALAGVDLIVMGAPLLGFSLPTEEMLKNIGSGTAMGGRPPDVSHPSMRSWLQGLPAGKARAAAFETRIWWSPGSAARTILREMEVRGYTSIAKAQRFVVQGKYGPLREGEIERARAWGLELAQELKVAQR